MKDRDKPLYVFMFYLLVEEFGSDKLIEMIKKYKESDDNE